MFAFDRQLTAVRTASRGLPALVLAGALAACGGSQSATPVSSSPVQSGDGVTIYDQTTSYVDESSPPEASAQYEIVTPTGRHVYVDVTGWNNVNKQPTADDILLITHGHFDHQGTGVVENFPGKSIVMKVDSIDLPDVKVTSVMGKHSLEETLAEADDVIFVIETGGIRLAHFGDLGETALTPDQQKVVGTPDVLFTQLENEYSGIKAGSTAAIDLVNSVKPKIVVPTHIWGDAEMAKTAAAAWPAMASTTRSMHVDPTALPGTTTIVFSGLNADLYAKDLSLKAAPW